MIRHHSVIIFLQMDITDKQVHETAKEILLEMGEFFQIQVTNFRSKNKPKITSPCDWTFEIKEMRYSYVST